MLFIGRKSGQHIEISHPLGVVIVTVFNINKGRVTLGIAAEKEIKVNRPEYRKKTVTK